MGMELGKKKVGKGVEEGMKCGMGKEGSGGE